MEELKINPTKEQVRKLMRYKPVQLKASQVGSGMKVHHEMPIHHKKAIRKATRLQKGVRLAFQPHELIEGSGFLDWLKSLGNMIVGPAKALAPVLKPLAKEIGAPIVSRYTGIPTDVLKQGVDLTASLAGVGVKKQRKPKKVVFDVPSSFVPPKTKLQDDFSTLVNPQHPIYKTSIQLPPHDLSGIMTTPTMRGKGIGFTTDVKQYTNPFTPLSIPPTFSSGGSFRVAGGSFKPAGKGGRVRYTK